MPIPNQLIDEILERSLNEFLAVQGVELAAGVSERNSCARLGCILERNAIAAGRYFADPEYNRKQGGRIKTILDEQMHEIVIVADLILHSRGAHVAEDDLVAIEMKKVGRPKAEKVADRNRLRAMTKGSYDSIWSNDGTTHPEHVCGYHLGVFIELSASKRTAHIEYFRTGDLIGSTARTF